MSKEKTIYKFPILLKSNFRISMPEGYEILHVDMQNGHPCLWALVDPEAPPVYAHFWLYGTGQPISPLVTRKSHIATWQFNGYVWHLFGDPK